MQPPLYRNRFRIPSARRPGWDYRWPGAYMVTLCVQGRICLLGEVVEGTLELSPYGKIAAEEWQRIPTVHPWITVDEWIVMPNHLHGILVFQRETPEPPAPGRLTTGSLGAVVGQFKQRSTKRIRARRQPDFTWQDRFYDQIIEDDDARERCRAYIRENPLRWQSQQPGQALP